MTRISVLVMRLTKLSTACVVLLSATFATAAETKGVTSRWSDDSVYDTTRMLPYNGNECANVPNCVTVKGPRVKLDADTSETFAVTCPEGHPYGWHWDTRQHEHILVQLVARTVTGLTFRLLNRAESAAGKGRVFVGCSSEPFSVTDASTQLSRSGVPSKCGFSARRGCR